MLTDFVCNIEMGKDFCIQSFLKIDIYLAASGYLLRCTDSSCSAQTL